MSYTDRASDSGEKTRGVCACDRERRRWRLVRTKRFFLKKIAKYHRTESRKTESVYTHGRSVLLHAFIKWLLPVLRRVVPWWRMYACTGTRVTSSRFPKLDCQQGVNRAAPRPLQPATRKNHWGRVVRFFVYDFYSLRYLKIRKRKSVSRSDFGVGQNILQDVYKL